MDWLLRTYRQIPPELLAPLAAFAASLLTAIVAFTGIILSNRAAQRRQSVELRAAEERARLEREQTLRKTIYLETLDDLGRTQGALLDLWNFQKGISDSAFGESHAKYMGGLFRAYLVASPRVTERLVAVQEAVTSAGLNAMPLRVRHANLLGTSKAIENMHESVKKERAGLDAELKGENLSAERRAQIDLRLREVSSIQHKSAEHILDAAERNTAGVMDIFMIGARHRLSVESKIFAFIAAIRDELALPALGADTIRSLEDASKRGVEEANKALAEFKEMIPSLTTTIRGQMERSRKRDPYALDIPPPSPIIDDSKSA